jgi:predicted secreted protein
MIMTNAISGFGTILVWNYNRLLEMTSISGPSQSRDTIDVTSHDSLDMYREFIAGPASGGEVSVEGNLIIEDELGQMNFYEDLQAGTKRSAWIVLPMATGAAMSFNAIPTNFSPSSPYEDKISASMAMQITGKPVLYTTQSAGMTNLTGIRQTGTAALTITPAVAPGTYKYTTSVDAASTWVKLTVTAAAHTIYVQGVAQTSGTQGGEIALNPAGETTDVFILVYQTAKSPRLYVLTVTRPVA